MAIWAAMRAAAISRHRYINLMFENGCPVCWQRHMLMIRWVYGW